MSYHAAKTVELPFDEAVAKVTAELQKEGFGIITQIDLQEAFRKKLNLEFRRYKILGACNPTFAHRALQAEPRLGVLLPCNVAVQEMSPGVCDVAAVNPMETMKAVQNPALGDLAQEVQTRLQRVIAAL